MTAHEPSGTPSRRPPGTPGSDDQEPKSAATRQSDPASAAPNLANRQSDRLLLTSSCCGQAAERGPRADSDRAPLGSTHQTFTRVELHKERGLHKHWLRFGKPAASTRDSRGHRVECYAPGQIFGLAQSIAATRGDASSTFEVHQACGSSQQQPVSSSCLTGSIILLSVKGWRHVRHVLGLIDAIEALGIDPCSLAPAFWLEIHMRLAGRHTREPKAPYP